MDPAETNNVDRKLKRLSAIFVEVIIGRFGRGMRYRGSYPSLPETIGFSVQFKVDLLLTEISLHRSLRSLDCNFDLRFSNCIYILLIFA